jgi:C4-dicarboxylate transporter DctM subunit
MGIAFIFASLCALVFVGVPVAFSIGLTALANLMIRGDLPLTIMVQRMLNGLDSFPILRSAWWDISKEASPMSM